MACSDHGENQYGRIENLRVAGGQPVPDQHLKIVRVARFGISVAVATMPAQTDAFELKQALRDLFSECPK